MTSVALLDWWMLTDFLDETIHQYRMSLQTRNTEQHLPRSWGLLLGTFEQDGMRVREVAFGTNVRETDESVLAEFDEVIVPCFGTPYANGGRGFWCSNVDVMKITRDAAARDLEVLGSIHSHPDWHQIGPEHERAQRLSQNPTAMDEYLFRNTGWPLNMICYLESRDNEIFHTLAAWGPPSFVDKDKGADPITIRFTLARRALKEVVENGNG
jgi:proteasome lid subunit RPN8/RPN11